MDRAIVYTAALPQTLDILNSNKFGMLGMAYAMHGILGTNTVVEGLACLATSPTPNLNVSVGVGSIYAQDPTDATAYSDLGVDNTVIIKQGINPTAVTLTITPPGTTGFSQVYLIQASLSDVDTGSMVLPYYNANNPSQPFSGPGNSGTSQYTIRQVKCNIALKAGLPASTGTEVAPSPDPGFVGMFTIDVANGTTQITQGMIKLIPAAPFFPTLPAVPNDVQTELWVYANDTGVVNAMIATIAPPITTLVPGLRVVIKAAFANTAAATLNLNGQGAQPIHRANGSAVVSGDYAAGQLVAMVWDGAAFQIENYFGFTATTTNNNNFVLNIPYAVDTGVVNAVVGVFSPAVTTLAAGLTVEVQIGASNTNTGPATLQCNSTAAKPILRNSLPLTFRDLLANTIYLFVYDGTQFELINARYPFISFDESAPPAADIPLAVGDQLTVTFTGVTSVPLKVATVQGLYRLDGVTYNISGPNSTDNDLILLPNNTTYGAGDISNYNAVPATDPGGVISQWYQTSNFTQLGTGWNNAFSMDMMQNDVNPAVPPGVNSGPYIWSANVSTFTVCKMMHWLVGGVGGPASAFDKWNNTSIAWTSLGTFINCWYSNQPSQRNTISGSIAVRRIL